MKINLACGNRKIDGYEGVDILDFGQKYVMDAFKFLKTRRSSIEAITMSHFLEHWSVDDAIKLLNLCHDKLIDGGELYIIVPSKDRPEAYQFTHKSFYSLETFRKLKDKEYCRIYGFKQWRIKKLVQNNRGDIHCWLEKI